MISKAAMEWINTARSNLSTTSTLFVQGVFSSHIVAAKYTGARGFVAETGERVTCKCAIDVINHAFIGTEMSDTTVMRYHGEKNHWLWVLMYTPLQWIQFLVSFLVNRFWWGMRTTLEYDWSRGRIMSHAVNRNVVNVGQQGDVRDFQNKMSMFRYFENSDPEVVFGVSRGAATIFNGMAQPAKRYDGVKLVVLEGCPASIDHVFLFRYGAWTPLVKKVAGLVFQKLKNVDPATQPINRVNEFQPNVPVAFITSMADKSVPPEGVIGLANVLNARGLNPVYLLILKRSSHPAYMCDDPEDSYNYTIFMHALYELYGLDHIPVLADAGRELLISTLL